MTKTPTTATCCVCGSPAPPKTNDLNTLGVCGNAHCAREANRRAALEAGRRQAIERARAEVLGTVTFGDEHHTIAEAIERARFSAEIRSWDSAARHEVTRLVAARDAALADLATIGVEPEEGEL